MAFLARIVQFLFALLVVRFVLRGVAAVLRGQANGPRRSQAEADPLVRDRVCNTFLPRSRAITATVRGQQEHFCSEACRRQALARIA